MGCCSYSVVVSAVWLGLLVLATAGAAVWQASCVSADDVGDYGELYLLLQSEECELKSFARRSCYGSHTSRPMASGLAARYCRDSLEPRSSLYVRYPSQTRSAVLDKKIVGEFG